MVHSRVLVLLSTFFKYLHICSVGDKQIFCLGPNVIGGTSVSSILIRNIFLILPSYFTTPGPGGTAQTGGVGSVARMIPPPTSVIVGAVAAPSILVPVPGQVQVVTFILMIFRLYQSLPYLVLNFIPLML